MPSSFLAAARGDAKPSGGSPALPSLRALGLLNCVAEVATADELVSAAAGLSPSLSVLLLGGTRLRRADMPVAAHPEEAALVVAAESTLPKLALLECTFCTRERSDARQSSLLAEGTDSTCVQHMALRGAGWDLMRLRDAVELAGGGRALLTRQGFGPTDASLMLRAAAQCAANGQRAPLHGRSNYASSRRLGDVQSRPKKSGQRTESPREAGEPRRKARWWTEAPIPPPVLRTARTPSPGGRKPPGRHTTPRPPTCLQRHRLCVTARRVVASRQDATGAGPPTSSYLLATPQALRNSARCAATGQPETGLDNKP